MALDQSFVGRTYPPTRPYEVGREKIREFAEAVGDTNPAYMDPEAAKALGHPDVIAPPTFVFAITFKAAGQVIAGPAAGPGLQPGRARRPEVRLHAPGAGRGPADGHLDDRGDQVHGGQRHPGRPRRRARRVRRARRDRLDQAGGARPPRRRDDGDAKIAYDDVEVGTELPARTFPVTAGHAGAVRGRLRRLQPDPLEREVRHARSACPTSSRTACSPWPRRSGSSPTGSATRARSSSTGCGSPSRSSCRTTTQGALIEVSGKVAAKLDDNARCGST